MNMSFDTIRITYLLTPYTYNRYFVLNVIFQVMIYSEKDCILWTKPLANAKFKFPLELSTSLERLG